MLIKVEMRTPKCTGLSKFPQSGGTDTHYIRHYRCWLKWGQSFSLLESQFLSINYCYFHFIRISFHLLWADLLTLWCTVKQIRFGLRRMHGRPTNQLHPCCASSSRWPSPKSARLGHCTATNAKSDSVTVARSRAFYSTDPHHSQSNRGSQDLEPVNQGVHCGAAALAWPGSLPGMQSLGPHRRPARSEPAFWADPWDPCAPALTSAHLLDEKEKERFVSKSNWNLLWDPRPLNLSGLHFPHLKTEGHEP